MQARKPLFNTVNTTIEVSIRLLFFFFITSWCLMIMLPFLTPVLWGIIMAVSIAPLYKKLNRRLNNKPKLAAFFIALFMLMIFVVPSILFLNSIIHGVHNLGLNLSGGTFKIPPPAEEVKSWPIVGGYVTDLWTEAYENLGETVKKFSPQLSSVGKWLLNAVKNIGLAIGHFVLSIGIACVLLATKGTDDVAARFYNKLVGDRGAELKSLTELTIKNVTKGILGVSFIQSIYLGLIFILAGVPHAGIWALICFVLATVQIGPFLVVIPVIIYLFSTLGTTAAIAWSVALVIGTLLDNVLKPILLGKGAPVPMLVIFIGAIGGFILSGFIGLFTGAIVLSLGYKLFGAWLYDESERKPLNS